MEDQDGFAARVVGRLFSISMAFASLQQSVTDTKVREELSRIVDECDATIAEVRASILGLDPEGHGQSTSA